MTTSTWLCGAATAAMVLGLGGAAQAAGKDAKVWAAAEARGPPSWSS
ncbi:hypothetical protein [Phenylobacterium aquaticum]|nr:hypothetical protein [Phenylobacterium aquaticum]MCI3132897.1 hypothetical protein [Phenylobacterium aquaticum]